MTATLLVTLAVIALVWSVIKITDWIGDKVFGNNNRKGGEK